MNNTRDKQPALTLLSNSTLVLFIVTFLLFSVLAPRFFSLKNFENILANASYIGIIAVGISFVLLTGGIDLSVGSVMYVSCLIAGLAIKAWGLSPFMAFLLTITLGSIAGTINAFAVVKFKLYPFIVTLGTMISFRGLGVLLSKARAVSFPDSISQLSSVRIVGFIPFPIFIFLMTLLIATLLLRQTKFGRQLYAVGNNCEAASKAGLNTDSILFRAYIISSVFAALGGFISISQLGSLDPVFGDGEEFDAIAAAVLGGISLFGGIGGVFPGVLLGAVLIQMVQAGLIFLNVDLYIQPMITALIILIAVFVDTVRTGIVEKSLKKHIIKV